MTIPTSGKQSSFSQEGQTTQRRLIFLHPIHTLLLTRNARNQMSTARDGAPGAANAMSTFGCEPLLVPISDRPFYRIFATTPPLPRRSTGIPNANQVRHSHDPPRRHFSQCRHSRAPRLRPLRLKRLHTKSYFTPLTARSLGLRSSYLRRDFLAPDFLKLQLRARHADSVLKIAGTPPPHGAWTCFDPSSSRSMCPTAGVPQQEHCALSANTSPRFLRSFPIP